jgi:predicted metal-dependent hydrolase
MKKTQNIVYYHGIGTVSYIRNPRARNLTIRINQQGEVRVTLPRMVSWSRAESFFLSRQDWVRKKLDQMQKLGCGETLPEVGKILRIRGREHPIGLQKGEKSSEDAIWRILRQEALEHLPGRVEELSAAYGYTYSGLKIRKMKTRWGSCTTRKSINLNSWLMMIPESLCDYVILHELAHTRFPDHGKKFWEEVDRTTGGLSAVYRKELRRHRILCFNREADV